MKTRFLLVIAVVIAALSVTPATAATLPHRVTVSASPDGLVAPGVATLRPGTNTFTVSTSDTQRRYVGVVGLKPGASFDNYLDNMAIVLFGPDAEKPRAGAAVQRDVAVGGGVVVYSRAAQSTTVVLAPGTYYLVDYTSLRAERHWHRITVSGEWSHTNPGTDHVVLQYERDGQPRFAAPSRIAPRGSILVANTTAVLRWSPTSVSRSPAVCGTCWTCGNTYAPAREARQVAGADGGHRDRGRHRDPGDRWHAPAAHRPAPPRAGAARRRLARRRVRRAVPA